MATDQGKTSNMNGLSIASNAVGKVPPSVGLTTFRPPYTPTTFGVFAGYNRGPLFEVSRRAPIDAWVAENSAVFERVSQWRRAWYFPKPGEDIHHEGDREYRGNQESLGKSWNGRETGRER